MPTTQISQNIRPNHVAAIVTKDGQRLGHVIARGKFSGLMFEAHRKNGVAGVDIRRVAPNFRSVEAAARWIEASA